MRVLIVEDDQLLANQLEFTVSRVVPEALVTICHTKSDARKEIEAVVYDFAIIDLFLETHMTLAQDKSMMLTLDDLKDAEGPELGRLFKTRNPSGYAIMVSATKRLSSESLGNLTDVYLVDEFLSKNQKTEHGVVGWGKQLEDRLVAVQSRLIR